MNSTDDTNAAARGSALTDLLGLAPERAAFEAWAKDQGFPLERLDAFGCEMDYRDLRTHTAWEGFCVGVAAERERCADECRKLAAMWRSQDGNEKRAGVADGCADTILGA